MDEIVQMLQNVDLLKIIDIVVEWLPVALLLLCMLIGFLRGMRRGLRRSIISLIHTTLACVICIVFYLLCIRSERMDEFMLTFADFIIGKINGGTLASLLKVSGGEEFACLKDVIRAYLLSMSAGDNEGIASILLASSGAYIDTVISFAYHIAFFVVTIVVFIILRVLFYLLYLFFYSEGKKKRKMKRKAKAEGKKSPYKKKRMAGGLVGVCRGVVAGILSIILLGSFFFVLVGDEGNGVLSSIEVDFGNDMINTGVEAYKCIDSYGTKGVMKLFNSVKDSREVPLYLFVTDLIFSGEMTDDGEVTRSYYLREETSAFVSFAKNAVALVCKYNDNKLPDFKASDLMDKLLVIFEKDGFQEDFSALIDSFNANTFVFTYAMALIDVLSSNIGEFQTQLKLDDKTTDLLQILFTKNYYSETIPAEAKCLEASRTDSITLTTLPYIKASELVTKDDILTVIDIAFEVLSSGVADNLTAETRVWADGKGDEGGDGKIIPGEPDPTDPTDPSRPSGKADIAQIAETVLSILPRITELSIFSDDRKSELNPLLGRLFAYCEATILGGGDDELVTDATVTIPDYYTDCVDWIGETKQIVTLADPIYTVYAVVTDEQKADLAKIDALFEEGEAKTALNSVLDYVSNSQIMSKVLSTSFVTEMISGALKGISANIYIPDDMTYVNVYEGETLVRHGELSTLVATVQSIYANPATKGIVSKALTSEKLDIASLLVGEGNEDGLVDVMFDKDDSGKAMVDYLFDSQIVTSLVSGLVIDNSGEGKMLYVPESTKQVDAKGNVIPLIKTDVLMEIINVLPDLAPVITDLLGEGASDPDMLTSLIGDVMGDTETNPIAKAFKQLQSNLIIQGTVSNLLINKLQGTLVIPQSLSTVDSWLSTGTKEGEFETIINTIRLLDLDIGAIIGGSGSTDAVMDMLVGVVSDDTKVNALFDSRVLHFTVSSLLVSTLSSGSEGGISIVVPGSAKDNLPEEFPEGATDTTVIKKDALTDLLSAFKSLIGESGELDLENTNALISSVFANSDDIFKSDILGATMINVFASMDISVITIPESLKKQASTEAFETYPKLADGSENEWLTEFPTLIDFIKKLFADEEGNIDFEAITSGSGMSDLTSMLSDIISDEQGVSKMFESKILHFTISSLLVSNADALGSISLIIPSSSKDNLPEEFPEGATDTTVITKDALTDLLSAFNSLIGESGELDLENTNALISSVFANSDDIFKSDILGATMINVFASMDISVITIPESLKKQASTEAFETYPKLADGSENEWLTEFPTLIDFIKKLFADEEGNIDFEAITSGSGMSDPTSMLSDIISDEQGASKMFESKILHFAISSLLVSNADALGSISLIIPSSSKDNLPDEFPESATDTTVITKDALTDLFKALSCLTNDKGELALDGMEQIFASVLGNKDKMLVSDIFSATIIGMINGEGTFETITIPASLKSQGSKTALETYPKLSDGSTNEWTSELPCLLDSIEEIFTTSTGEIVVDLANIEGSLTTLLSTFDKPDTSVVKHGESKLTVFYASSVMSVNISDKLLAVLDRMVDEQLVDEVKDDNGIMKKEEIEKLLESLRVLTGDELDINNLDIDVDAIFGVLTEQEDGEYKNFNMVYNSVLVAGLATEKLRDVITSSGTLQDNANAYKEEYPMLIYKESEFTTFLGLCDGSPDSIATSLTSKPLATLKISFFDVDDEGKATCKSYLMVSAFSNFLTDGSMGDVLVIPQSELESESTLLKASAIYDVFDIMTTLLTSDSNPAPSLSDMSGFEFDAGVILNKENTSLFTDNYIMRATVSKVIGGLQQDGWFVANGTRLELAGARNDEEDDLTDYEETKDVGGNDIVILSSVEMKYIIQALGIVLGDDATSLEFSISYEDFKSMDSDKMSAILDSDSFLIIISALVDEQCDSIRETPAAAVVTLPSAVSCDVYDISDRSTETRNIYTKADIIDFMSNFPF